MEQHWSGYLAALGNQKIPVTSMPTAAPYETSSNQAGVSGFMDLVPRQPAIQARYDAMQGTWEGPTAADKAISKGLFKTEAMPIQQKHPYSK
jgi:hypothetical protein